ncbi:glycoside hydrolase family 15 protein [Fluviispira sanaruensis]|uniref:Glycoside hydrolase family 15 n=1 Tax=Fluviispira sanaruensis TaxID=2493639 RepID=A0A4P2VJL4_FLUSA|nr:glycoside hydrolase family 15 protein [Fluviispira sanaruensis]BBH53413.1 glycoside hydrolase family 15 [Fluviispira sanaruensis]
MSENYSSIVASDNILACLGEDGQLKGLFWPFKDAHHSHLDFSICGLAIDGESIWLDKIRDKLRISFFPKENALVVHWNIQHPRFQNIEIIKKVIPNGSALIEQWSFEIPIEFADKKIQLWLLSSWKMHNEKRFQAVYSETGEDLIFAYNGNYWVGIAACNDSQFSHFQYVRAIQAQNNTAMGEMIDLFLRDPNHFRRIEMGLAYAAACTQPLTLTQSIDNNNIFTAKISIIYEFGFQQEEVEQKFALYLDNDPSINIPNETINKNKIDHQRRNIINNLEIKKQHLKEVSLSVLKSLTDQNGGILAAPECDSDFKHSGGYGFIWPRDAAFCALSLIKCGYRDAARPILQFLCQIQSQSGDYFQRFDSQGNKAPSWCELQADQIGLVIVALLEFIRNEKNDKFLLCIKKGIQKLINDFNEKGSLQNSFDLWEEFYGLHFYSHICAHSALVNALPHFPDLKEEIKNSIKNCENFCYNHLYVTKQKRFARGVDPRNNRDLRADISLLSCIFPFNEFPIEDSLKISIFEFCYDKLSTKMGALRYENDLYMGGNSWILSGFWLAQAALSLAHLKPEFQKIAQDIFEKTLNLSNEAGYFPEQIHSVTGKHLWVVPLAWSHAFYLWTNENFKKSQ